MRARFRVRVRVTCQVDQGRENVHELYEYGGVSVCVCVCVWVSVWVSVRVSV